MKTKKGSKPKQTYWDHLLAKQKPHTARPKHKATRKPQPTNTHTMSTQAEADEPKAQVEEEFLPPPGPPTVPSEPTEPPGPLDVDESEKGAQPEESAVRELNLIPDTPVASPRPEEPEGDLKERLSVEEPA